MSGDLENIPLVELFRIEAEGQLTVLSEGILALEKPAVEPATIESLMRAAHSLKGAARIVGLDPAVRVAHVLEDYFVAVQRGQIKTDPTHVDVLLRGVDLLNQISHWEGHELPRLVADNESTIAVYVNDLRAVLSGSPLPSAAAGSRRYEVISGSPTPTVQESPPPKPVPPAVPPEPPASPASRPTSPEKVDRVIRVAADSLNRLMGLAGESLVASRQFRPFVGALRKLKNAQDALWDHIHMLEECCASAKSITVASVRDLLNKAREQTGQCQLILNDRIQELDGFAHRGEELSNRLHHEVIVSRMRPLADGIRGFPRMVRDVARQLGKTVEFEVRGETTGVDRDVLDKLEAPLNHLIRNALDHGLETPEERRAKGKSEIGSIRLEASHRAGMLQLTIRDDGRGIDLDRLRKKVIEKGLVNSSMAEQLTEAELYDFLFLPGFTTRDQVSELSGRGVGLDVVQSLVRVLGGTVRVASVPNKETSFSLLLPISMSIIRALLVQIAGEPYAFPLTRIDRIEMLDPERIEWLEGRQYFTLDEQAVGLVAAAQVLELPEEPAKFHDSVPIVVISDRGHRFGIVVRKFLGERDLDVRPLDPRLGKVPNLGSASLLEDGSPVLIFDVEDLVRSIDNLLCGRRLKRHAIATGRTRPARRILVVDDSLTVRELERQLLSNHGYEVDVAVDGMDGWNAVRGGNYDLVVSDVDMPRMDGIELVRRIKQDAKLKSLPVVIVSYKDREEDRLRGLEAGANCYLTKSSFHDQTFLGAIFDLIGEART